MIVSHTERHKALLNRKSVDELHRDFEGLIHYQPLPLANHDMIAIDKKRLRARGYNDMQSQQNRMSPVTEYLYIGAISPGRRIKIAGNVQIA